MQTVSRQQSMHKKGTVVPFTEAMLKENATSAAKPVEVGAGTSRFSSWLWFNIYGRSNVTTLTRKDSKDSTSTDTISATSSDTDLAEFREDLSSLTNYLDEDTPQPHIYTLDFFSSLTNRCHEYILRYLPFSDANDKKCYTKDLIPLFRKTRFYTHEFAKCSLPSSQSIGAEEIDLDDQKTLSAYTKEFSFYYKNLATKIRIPRNTQGAIDVAQGDISMLMVYMYSQIMEWNSKLKIYGSLQDDLTTDARFTNEQEKRMKNMKGWSLYLSKKALKHFKSHPLFNTVGSHIPSFFMKLLNTVIQIESYFSDQSIPQFQFTEEKIERKIIHVKNKEEFLTKLEYACYHLQDKALDRVTELLENTSLLTSSMNNNQEKNDELIRFLVSSPETSDDLLLLIAYHGYCDYHQVTHENSFYDQLLESPAFKDADIAAYFNHPYPPEELLSNARKAAQQNGNFDDQLNADSVFENPEIAEDFDDQCIYSRSNSSTLFPNNCVVNSNDFLDDDNDDVIHSAIIAQRANP